jgi:hypothetical protein
MYLASVPILKHNLSRIHIHLESKEKNEGTKKSLSTHASRLKITSNTLCHSKIYIPHLYLSSIFDPTFWYTRSAALSCSPSSAYQNRRFCLSSCMICGFHFPRTLWVVICSWTDILVLNRLPHCPRFKWWFFVLTCWVSITFAQTRTPSNLGIVPRLLITSRCSLLTLI